MEANGVVFQRHTPRSTADLVDACEQYLGSLRCTLWGSAFEVVSPKGRRQAAEWLAAQIEAVSQVDA